jgi:hypothetical protein
MRFLIAPATKTTVAALLVALSLASPLAPAQQAATQLNFIDIVGIKLGMSPKDAFTAVKTFNANMKIDTVNVRLEPGDAPGTFKRVPRFAVAHTVGPHTNPLAPVPFNLADGSADVIVMEFTTPPSPPVVGRITRVVNFPRGQPVVASTLIDALRKKYGQDNVPGGSRAWVFDSSGKLLTRRLTPQERACVPATPYGDWGFGGGGLMPTTDDITHDAPGEISLLTTSMQPPPDLAEVCSPFTIAMNYGLGESVAPDTQMTKMIMTIQSPALLYASRKATHDWLQAQHDGKAKSQDDAALQRSAPKL